MKELNFYLSMLFLVLVLACSPKNEEVKKEQIEVSPTAEGLDSIADTKKDGVKTDENEINPTLPLPQPVLQLISNRYPGFKQPTLSNSASSRAKEHDQGAFIIRGDFNTDNQQDYGLQIQYEKDVLIIAVLDAGNGNWTIHELKKDILFNDRGTLKSLYYLFITNPIEKLQIIEAKGFPSEAISVGIEGNTTLYVYNGSEFEEFQTSE
jgi:hypothetical protein